MKFFLFWPLLNIHQLTLCYWIIHKERMGDVRTNSISRKKKKKIKTCALRFCSVLHPNTNVLNCFSRSSSLLFLFFCFFSTTRWRRVSCSGNSACKTHCLLSEELWLFQQLLEASGPTGGVFYHLSGLGTGSRSWDANWEVCHILNSYIY